jgi:hypothetical protein
MVILAVMTPTLIGVIVGFEKLLESSYVAPIAYIMTYISIILTMEGVAVQLKDLDRKILSLIRKWSHALSNIFFYVNFWLFVLYWTVLAVKLNKMKSPINSIDLEIKVLTFPFYAILANFIVTDMLLLSKFSSLVLKAYGIVYLWGKLNVIFVTQTINIEKIGYDFMLIMGILIVCFIP